MGWKFYAGVGLCLAGIVLMSFPTKPCVDCEDEVTEVVAEVIEEVTGD
jgi:hypothetical protein